MNVYEMNYEVHDLDEFKHQKRSIWMNSNGIQLP